MLECIGTCLAIDGEFWTMKIANPPRGVREQIVVMERDVIGGIHTGRGPRGYAR